MIKRLSGQNGKDAEKMKHNAKLITTREWDLQEKWLESFKSDLVDALVGNMEEIDIEAKHKAAERAAVVPRKITRILSEEIVSVVDAREMDDETFVKHMEARHLPMGGMKRLVWRRGQDISYVRAYHERVHAIAVPVGIVANHDHNVEYEPQVPLAQAIGGRR